jgi:hypothetical protein
MDKDIMPWNKKPSERREICPVKGRKTGQSGIRGGSRRLLGFGGAKILPVEIRAKFFAGYGAVGGAFD